MWRLLCLVAWQLVGVVSGYFVMVEPGGKFVWLSPLTNSSDGLLWVISDGCMTKTGDSMPAITFNSSIDAYLIDGGSEDRYGIVNGVLTAMTVAIAGENTDNPVKTYSLPADGYYDWAFIAANNGLYHSIKLANLEVEKCAQASQGATNVFQLISPADDATSDQKYQKTGEGLEEISGGTTKTFLRLDKALYQLIDQASIEVNTCIYTVKDGEFVEISQSSKDNVHSEVTNNTATNMSIPVTTTNCADVPIDTTESTNASVEAKITAEISPATATNVDEHVTAIENSPEVLIKIKSSNDVPIETIGSTETLIDTTAHVDNLAHTPNDVAVTADNNQHEPTSTDLPAEGTKGTSTPLLATNASENIILADSDQLSALADTSAANDKLAGEKIASNPDHVVNLDKDFAASDSPIIAQNDSKPFNGNIELNITNTCASTPNEPTPVTIQSASIVRKPTMLLEENEEVVDTFMPKDEIGQLVSEKVSTVSAISSAVPVSKGIGRYPAKIFGFGSYKPTCPIEGKESEPQVILPQSFLTGPTPLLDDPLCGRLVQICLNQKTRITAMVVGGYLTNDRSKILVNDAVLKKVLDGKENSSCYWAWV